MLIFILGILDMIAGGLLWMSLGGGFTGSSTIMIFAIIFILKGIFSILSGAASGFYFDVLGVMDLITGFFLLLSIWGITFGFFFYLAIAMIIKGLYSFGMGFASGSS